MSDDFDAFGSFDSAGSTPQGFGMGNAVGPWTQHWSGSAPRVNQSRLYSVCTLPRRYWDLEWQDRLRQKKLDKLK